MRECVSDDAEPPGSTLPCRNGLTTRCRNRLGIRWRCFLNQIDEAIDDIVFGIMTDLNSRLPAGSGRVPEEALRINAAGRTDALLPGSETTSLDQFLF
jgi:hypothetical protein